MAYTPKHRYKSRHERYQTTKRNTKLILIFAGIALVILLFKNRVYLWDMVRFYF